MKKQDNINIERVSNGFMVRTDLPPGSCYQPKDVKVFETIGALTAFITEHFREKSECFTCQGKGEL